MKTSPSSKGYATNQNSRNEQQFDTRSQKSSLSQKSNLSTINSACPVFFPPSLNKALQAISLLVNTITDSSISQDEKTSLLTYLKAMKSKINYAQIKNVSVDQLFSECSHEWNNFSSELEQVEDNADINLRTEFCTAQTKELSSLIFKLRPSYNRYKKRKMSAIMKEIDDGSNDENILNKIEQKICKLEKKLNITRVSAQENEEEKTQNENENGENENENGENENGENENENGENENENENGENENGENENENGENEIENGENENGENENENGENENENENGGNENGDGDWDENSPEFQNKKWKSIKLILNSLQQLLSRPICHSKVASIEQCKKECRTRIDLMKQCFSHSEELKKERHLLQIISHKSMTDIVNAFREAQKEETQMLANKFVQDQDESHRAAQRATKNPNHDQPKKAKTRYPKKEWKAEPIPSYTKVQRAPLYEKSRDKESITPQLSLRPKKSSA